MTLHQRGYDGRLFIPKGTTVTPRVEVVGISGARKNGTMEGGRPRIEIWNLYHGDEATVVQSYERTIKGWMGILCVTLRLPDGALVADVPAAKLRKLEK